MADRDRSDPSARAGRAPDRAPAPGRAEPAPPHGQPTPSGEAPLPADSEFRAEVDALFALVRRRYGARLTEAELEGVRKGVQGIVEGARALRAVRLGNADEPFQPFSPYRSDA
jgi:hypothetical protein